MVDYWVLEKESEGRITLPSKSRLWVLGVPFWPIKKKKLLAFSSFVREIE